MKRFHLQKFVQAEINTALGNDNMYYTGEKLRHPPTPDEAMEHFVKSGGAERFAAEHRQEFMEEIHDVTK